MSKAVRIEIRDWYQITYNTTEGEMMSNTDTQYAIATQRNMYQPDHEGAGRVAWLTDVETGGGYHQAPIEFATIEAAQARIDEFVDGDYTTSNNEAGRPDWWIVPVDAIDAVKSCQDDMGNYNWPDDCDTWECGDGKGNVCGDCDHCIEWMAGQDEDVLRAADCVAALKSAGVVA